MATITIQLKVDYENHSIKAIAPAWTCKAWKLPRTLIAKLPKELSKEDATWDICGIYLLLSADAVYVGEAEQVITRLKQHNVIPPFDWNIAIAFVSKEESLEKSHIKYLEHEVFKVLKTIKHYTLINNSTPTRSHVSDEDTMQAYLEYIIKLSEVLVGEDVFDQSKKEITHISTILQSQIKDNNTISENSFITYKIKAQDIARKAIKYALENHLFSRDDIAFLCEKKNAKVFKGGGIPLLKCTDGNPNDVFTGKHHNSYNHEIVCAYEGKYLISHELYNCPDNPKKDSRVPLLRYLVTHGLTLEKIFNICQQKG